MWIKICGITSQEDAEIAVAAGADAVGFVFAASPRRVTAETVAAISRRLPQSIEKIGVFVDASLDEMLSAIHTAALTGVQLHGKDCAELSQELRQRADEISRPLHIVHVLHYDGDAERFGLALRAACENTSAETILVDTRIAGKPGGTGVAFDWLAARNHFAADALHHRLIAAGGLRPENIREAVRTLRPWGVDVSSGVESAPGRKDRERVTAFIRAAREAARELEEANAGMHR
jgi:phosphoribosylanthranilate isomerase